MIRNAQHEDRYDVLGGIDVLIEQEGADHEDDRGASPAPRRLAPGPARQDTQRPAPGGATGSALRIQRQSLQRSLQINLPYGLTIPTLDDAEAAVLWIRDDCRTGR